MELRRGFKAEAAALAGEIRGELGLGPYDRLDPRALARLLDIPITPLSDLVASCEGARYLSSTEPDAFSAVTVFHGYRRMIVYNDSHSPSRQNSNICHELGHGLLLHEPAPALDMITGCRVWNAVIEKEADWLAGELLVTEAMTLAVGRSQFTWAVAQERLGVSEQMLRWRYNMTGAARRTRTARAG